MMKRGMIFLGVMLCSLKVWAVTPTLVQYSTFAQAQGNNSTQRLMPMPNPVLSGNILICLGTSNNAVTPTFTDDKGGSWTTLINTNDAGNGQRAFIIYRANITDGTRIVTWTNGTGFTFASAFCAEYYNVALTSVTDGGVGATGSSTTPASGSMTTTVDGDLILSYAIRDDADALMTGWTAGASNTLLSADYADHQGAQFQIQAVHGAVNPSFTAAPSIGWICVQGAFKAASAGTAPTISPRIIGIHHQAFLRTGNPTNWANLVSTGAGVSTITSVSATFTAAMVGNYLDIASGTNFVAGVYKIITFNSSTSIVLASSPTPGGAGLAGVANLGVPLAWPASSGGTFLYAAFIALHSMTSIIDTSVNTWTATGANLTNGGSGTVRAFYAKNATLGSANTFFVNTTGTGGAAPGDTVFLYECTGLSLNPDPFDKETQATGTGTNPVGPSLTPAKSGGIIFNTIGVTSNTVTANSASSVFVTSTDPNQEVSPWPNDENNGWAYTYNANTSAVQVTWSNTNAGAWAGIADAFEPGVTGGGPPSLMMTGIGR